MSKPFIITKTRNDMYTVSWPTFGNIKDSVTNIKLLDILFGELKCDEAGLAILLHGGDIDLLWISSIVWHQDVKQQYGDYLQDMYEIRGAVFRKEDEAVKFQDILEKKYIWKVLSA